MTHHLKSLFLLPVLAVFGFGFISTAQASAAPFIKYTVCGIKKGNKTCQGDSHVSTGVRDIPAGAKNPRICFGSSTTRCGVLRYDGSGKGSYWGALPLAGLPQLQVGQSYTWNVRWTTPQGASRSRAQRVKMQGTTSPI